MEHEIVMDLLPLYHDGVCSDASRAAVEEHLSTCEVCRTALAEMDAPGLVLAVLIEAVDGVGHKSAKGDKECSR